MRTHGKSATYKAGCRCAECTQANTDKMRAYYRRVGGNHNQMRYGHTCADCGVEWVSASKVATHCVSCANSRRKRKSRELVPVGPPDPCCVIPESHPARQPAPKPRKWVSGFCRHCGATFVVRDQLSARFCSQTCREQHSGRRFKISRKMRLAIYERDGWVCQLCNGPVDKTLPHTDPWSATLDHVECQAWTLLPDHSPANLRLAHRWCNSVRGDETYFSAEFFAA